jgi:hypothetical protein
LWEKFVDKKTFTRREMIACLMAGGVVTASGLWWKGEKLISIPKYTSWYIAGDDPMFELTGNTIKYVGPEHQGITMKVLHDWIAKHNPWLEVDPVHVTHHNSGQWVELKDGYRFKNPEHLTHGAIIQDSGKPDWQQGGANKEIWSSDNDLKSDDLVSDKIYFSSLTKPRERITEAESGDLGLR